MTTGNSRNLENRTPPWLFVVCLEFPVVIVYLYLITVFINYNEYSVLNSNQ